MDNYPDWLRISIFGVTQLMMLIGLFGLFVPVFPGIMIIWLASLGYGIVTGFNAWAIFFFVLITLLMIAGTTVDNLLMGAGARKGGASWLTIGVALVAGIVGTILLPPFGGLIAAPLGILLLELWRHEELEESLERPVRHGSRLGAFDLRPGCYRLRDDGCVVAVGMGSLRGLRSGGEK